MLNFIQISNITGLQMVSCAVAENKILKLLFHDKYLVLNQWGLELPVIATITTYNPRLVHISPTPDRYKATNVVMEHWCAFIIES